MVSRLMQAEATTNLCVPHSLLEYGPGDVNDDSINLNLDHWMIPFGKFYQIRDDYQDVIVPRVYTSSSLSSKLTCLVRLRHRSLK